MENQEHSDIVHESISETNNVSAASRLYGQSARKQPPPESAQSVRLRTFVISSFWAVVVLLGLPTWWWTTSIHRARLPLEEMLEWADGKVNGPCYRRTHC